MPRHHHHIAQDLSKEDLLQERGLLIRAFMDMRDEIRILRQQVTILSSKQMSAQEWVELRDWCKMTGEGYETAKRKCALGEYYTKPRDKKGAKYYIHRSELARHKPEMSQ